MTRTGPLNPNGIAVPARRQALNRIANAAVRTTLGRSPFGRRSRQPALRSVTFVVPRYGREIHGGIERACLRLATGLVSCGLSVKVITSCATDHLSWANEFDPGATVEDGVAVTRLATDRLRHGDLDRLSESIHPGYVTARLAEQEQWFAEQGPHCPELADELRADTSDLVVAMPYLYWPTLVASQLVASRLVMHPAAHDEWPFSLALVTKMLRASQHLIFHSDAERNLVESTHWLRGTPGTVCSLGIDLPDPVGFSVTNSATAFASEHPYLLYVGRVEEAKGVYELIEQVVAINQQRSAPVRLVVAGQGTITVPNPPNVEFVGVVTDAEKWRLLRGAVALVMPSAKNRFRLRLSRPWRSAHRCWQPRDAKRCSAIFERVEQARRMAGNPTSPAWSNAS